MASKPESQHRIFLSVAEDSADMHAAALLRIAAREIPACSFYGLAGPRSREAGADVLVDLTTHAAMLTGIFSVLGRAYRALKLIEKDWDARPPSAVLLLDSPELNLRLAKRAHARGIPVLYYIAPQTWASRAGRNRLIRHVVTRLACILPFEEDYFRREGVQAKYVGHPLFETLASETADSRTVERLRSGGGRLVAILPGSRRHVIDAVLPLQLEVFQKLRRRGLEVRAAVSAVCEERGVRIRACLDRSDVKGDIIIADNASLLSAADLVLAASGTATLHAAYYRKPMVVMYETGRLLRGLYPLLGRFVLKTPHLSLVNILTQRRVAPEFMPFVRDTDEVACVAGRLLTDETWRRIMIEQLDEVVRPLENTSASVNVCGIIRELLNSASA